MKKVTWVSVPTVTSRQSISQATLVTKEEAVWESFSEDEPVLKKPKPAPVSAKGKKGGKPGQGSIMNFFQKK